ncbi:MAG TPA: DUF2336 domain-containing protein [Rhodopila sp.]
MDADEAKRVRQGASETTNPDILRKLATDPSVTVRASLALNPALPGNVIAILEADTDARVRAILSRKLATLTSTMPSDTRQRVQQDAVASLTAMVADAALRVRASIAEAVREMPDGPRDIILRLAHDPAVMVCEPVILFSPMLRPEDLVALIASGPPPSTVMAVASRPRINEAVSDAIVGVADPAAIRALLCNPTAHIREATLDALAAQSEEQTDWQEPLVRRPHLPIRAQRMLSEIVAGHLLEILAARSDLDPKLAVTLRAALARDPPGGRAAKTGPAEAEPRAALLQAETLKQTSRLDDYAILDALRSNGGVTARAMLAVKAGVTLPVIDRTCDLRSAKGIVSLAWKAGFKPQTAVVLQTMLASVAPGQVLRPNEEGGFPLSEDEMRWQLTFLGAAETETRTWMPRKL